MSDFMRMYANLVDKCFQSCCNDFTTKALTTKEVSKPLKCFNVTLTHVVPQEQCIFNCTEKFVKHSERVGARFAEQNAGMHTFTPHRLGVNLQFCRNDGKRS
jgi:import inner membrane translocase subunit TIM9